MISDKCALVLTSTVYVSSPYTKLVDPEERKKQYYESIEFFIRESQLKKIIVCDNSGYHYSASLYDLARSYNKEIELLSFQGNKELVADYGKGYGEGEIMNFVLTSSNLIKGVEGFLKVTGRLKFINVDRVLSRCNHWENYFMPVSLIRPRFMVPKPARSCVEVKAYYTTIKYFKEVLFNAHTDVRDKNRFFLEHAYHKAMALSPVNVKCFPIAPEFVGISGSNGWKIKERGRLKKMLIKFVSVLGYIKPIYRS
ncbi:MAG TPA: hypothetical protein VFO70_00610 [Chitinophagaceae bacterium]|nr:hypothetical protein [Chitinophagaceae bacterium]